MLKRHWRKVVDFLLIGAVSGLVASHLGSTFLPNQEVSLEVGFSDNQAAGPTGTPAPRSGLTFAILDGSGFGSICDQSTNDYYRPWRDAVIGQMTVHSFWFLSAYAFATTDCQFDFSQFGGAYGWGVYNANHFIAFMQGSPWPCGAPNAVFGDVEYSPELTDPDPYLWGIHPAGQTYSANWSVNRSVIRGFEETVADAIVYSSIFGVGHCGKYLKGVYSNVGDWAAITNSASKSDVLADWFWVAHWGASASDISSERDTIESQHMRVFSWQYATDPACQMSDLIAAIEAGNAGIPKIDKWQRPDRDCPLYLPP